MGPLRLEWFPVPVRKSCICHTHWQMTLLRVCLVQGLGDIQDSHTLQCPQGNELFPECSSVLHVGGVFQCTCLEVTSSVWVCLTSQRSNAMGRAVKYFPNKHWKNPPEGKMIRPKEVTPAPKYIAIRSKEKKTSNFRIQVWLIFNCLFSWGVCLDMCRVNEATQQSPIGGEMVAQKKRAAGWVSETLVCIPHFHLPVPTSVLLPLWLPAVSSCLCPKSVTRIL